MRHATRVSSVLRSLLIVAVLLPVAAGCTVEQRLEVADDGTGAGTLTVTVDPVVVRYLGELAGAFGGEAEAVRLFDLAAIRRGIEDREGLELVSLEAPDGRTLEISYRVTDIEAALGDLVLLRQSAGDTRIDVELDRRSFITLSSLFLPADSPAAVFVPTVETDFLTTEEYLELASYVFAEYLEERTVEELFTQSNVETFVTPNGEIVTVTGGETVDGTARYRIPILDAVTLEEPIELSLSWR